MKVSRAQADENRERIIDVAGRMFRERGFDGIGIADLMKAAGLTHGGFYGNFKSKDDLIAQASARALSASEERWKAVRDQSGEDALAAIILSYVSARHRDGPGAGCALATLAPEAARHDGPVRSAFGAGVRAYLDILSRLVPGASAAARRRKAMSSLCEMVGAVILSRAVDDAALSDAILEATTANLLPRGAKAAEIRLHPLGGGEVS